MANILPQGSMINVKKILGIILLVSGISLVLGLNQIANLFTWHPTIYYSLVAFAGYLLLISGRRL